MAYKFKKCNFSEIKSEIVKNYSELLSPIDTFAESLIINSNHYKIFLRDTNIGYASIKDGSSITQFFLKNSYRDLSQEVFFFLKKLERVSCALVPTCDEFFLTHTLDDFSKLEKQSYFFKYRCRKHVNSDLDIEYRLATMNDLQLFIEINRESDTIFDETLEEQIKGEEIYIGSIEDEVVAFGILEPSKLIDEFASIGMYTYKNFRGKKIGTTTLSYMIDECSRRGLIPISGCWYYNHLSKKTLEAVGMVTETRYLKITF